MKTFLAYKPPGKTPLELINVVKVTHPELKHQKMAYAGRLDPLAEGLVLLLIGDECKNRTSYERLKKEYEFKILFGVATDSYDCMGLIQKIDPSVYVDLETNVIRMLPEFTGIKDQEYPPFSSARVMGKPLFYWARENKLQEITIPKKKIEIYSLEYLSSSSLSSKALLQAVEEKVSNVTGTFRQEEILTRWKTSIEPSTAHFKILKFKITCSSGTYVRSIAHEMGTKLQIPALAFNIKRTKIGEISL